MRYSFRSLIFAACVLNLSGTVQAAPKESLLYVQVRESKLRSKPQFWSPPVADLTYGSALVPVAAAPSDKSWIKTRLGNVEGFVHVSAVTRRKIVLSTSTAKLDKTVDSSIVLAGKGFNSQIENNYKASKGLDFAPVNEVETYKVASAAEEVFIRDGKLN